MPTPTGPHFIGIGAQKAGTTWLFEQLNALPQYAMLPEKELHYFDRDPHYTTTSFLHHTSRIGRFRQKGRFTKAGIQVLSALKAGQFGTVRFYQKWHFGAYTDEWYRGLFDSSAGYTGEICPGYALLSTQDIRRMYQAVPQAKVLYLLRNPVERAWSQGRFRKGNLQPDGEINPRETMRFLASDHQKQRSDYLGTFRRFAEVYPPEQLKICFYDAIKEQPISLLKEVTDFIGPVSESDLHKYCRVHSVYNRSASAACPPEVSQYLNHHYQEMIHELAELLGGYAVQWRQQLPGSPIQKAAERAPATVPWPTF